MKNSLTVMVIASALVSSAHAQSSVTVYGKVDLGLVIDSGNASGRSVRLSSGIGGGSRLGFRGEEDLGGGNTAGFQLETGYCADSAAVPGFCTGGNAFMGRQAHLDLTTAYGKLVAGRQYSLGYLTATTLDPFSNGYAGQVENTDGKGSYLVDTSGTRLNNSVAYTTPTFSGLSAGVEFALGEATGNWRANREVGATIGYAGGPVYAALSYYGVDNSNGQGQSRRATTGGATYDLGVVKLAGLVQKVGGEPTGGNRVDALNWMAGVTVPVAGGRILGSIVRHDDRTSLQKDATQWGIGYIYPLSKRTSLYTAFAHVANRNNAGFLVGNATDTGTGTRAFDLGASHNF
jgi:predicted porin